MTRDLALGAVLLAASALYYAMAAAIQESQLADAVGPQGLPKAYALLLGVLSLMVIARALRGPRGGTVPAGGDGPDARVGTVDRRVAGMLALGVVYVAVVPWAGYMLSLAGLMVGTACYQAGGVAWRRVFVGVAGAVSLWLVFVLLLGIPQPAGIWSSLW